MKTTKFSKILLVVLSFVLILGAAFAMSINASEETEKPEIISKNVFYSDKFQLMFAVTTDPAAAGDIKLYVYNDDPTVVEQDVEPLVETVMVSGSESGLGTDAYIFKITGVGAADMLMEFYVQAEDTLGNKSDVVKYSIAEYLYERLAGAKTISADQKEFYLNTINFGAKAQALFHPAGETLLSEYSYLYVNGAAKGIVPTGKKLNPYADVITSDWDVTTTSACGESTTTTQEKGFIIPENTIKTEVVPKNAVLYQTGRDTLSGSTVDGKTISVTRSADGVLTPTPDGKFATWSGTINYKYENDADRGVIANFEMTNSPRISFLKNYTLPEDQTATAFECSYDFKILTDGNVGATESVNMRMYLMKDNSTEIANQVYFWYNHKDFGANVGNSVGLSALTPDNNNASASNSRYVINGINPDDWIHIRFVVYASDTTFCYIYLNGSEEPVGKTALKSAFTGIENIGQGSIVSYSTDGNGIRIQNILIDNVFCGLTTDTLN